MKNILATLFFFLATTVAFAQQSNIDAVYLEDGTVLRGEIIEQTPNFSLKIKTSDGNIFVIPMGKVKKITKDQEENAVPALSLQTAPLQNKAQATKQKPEQKERDYDYVGGCRMYIAFGLSNIAVFDYSTYSGGKLEFGYYINPKNLLSFEIGSGSDELEDYTNLHLASWSYIVNLSEKFQWRIGPSLGILNIDEIQPEFTFGGNTGFIWNFSKNERWFLDIGVRLLKTSFDVGSQFNLSVGWRF